MAINSRQKGAAAEREIANILKEYGYDCRRGQQFCGANGDADVVGLDMIHLEIKRVEKLNIENAMQQSRSDAKEGEVPVVMHRRNRHGWLVTMDLEQWMQMYEAFMKSQLPFTEE